ncbi:hypothetical protein [Mesorhizobium sp. L-2-11]|uniref:hypothetical protein n=1 Tax=Mesorhizobium sp. L-2-11 TaxID=2744521 RepID=UPI00192611D6|nr:hypothetical protein [Mesorhizobium sp. L-2-11]
MATTLLKPAMLSRGGTVMTATKSAFHLQIDFDAFECGAHLFQLMVEGDSS